MSKVKDPVAYKFNVALNPYNPSSIMRMVKLNDEDAILDMEFPVTDEIEITDEDTKNAKGFSDSFIRELYSGIVTGIIFVIGDLPPYKIDEETVNYLENMSKFHNRYSVSDFDINKEYKKFLKQLKKQV